MLLKTQYSCNLKALFFTILFFVGFQSAFSQSILDKPFSAFKHGKIYNTITNQWDSFALCGQTILADSMGYFSLQSGCERSISLSLGHYTFSNDTFHITSFDFIREPEFLVVRRIPSTGRMQRIQFFTADFVPINGSDSSWVIRFFSKRKSFIVDKSGAQTISVRRNQYEGMELLQMSKLFGGPIVFFLDNRFDYKVVLNLPKTAVERYLTGAGKIAGIGVIQKDSLFLNNDEEKFNIVDRYPKP